MKKTILISVAHPDDESIGCGGAIAHHVRNKDKVYCIDRRTCGVEEFRRREFARGRLI